MNLSLLRDDLTDARTLGKLFIDGVYECETLEDCVRLDGSKVFGQTAIPAGRYRVIINHSPRFGIDMPLLCDVPGYSGVRIHPGNRPADTEGCLLVGTTRTPDMILESRDAYARLFAKLQSAQGDIFITITNPE